MLHSTTPVASYRGGPRVVWQIVQDTAPDESEGPVRHLELKLDIPPLLFCMSWCPDVELPGT